VSNFESRVSIILSLNNFSSGNVVWSI